MAGSAGPPIFVLPKASSDLPAIDRGHPRLATVATLIAFAALVPVFLFVAPESRWQPQDLFTLLLVFCFVSYGVALQLRAATTLDAGFVASLIAVVELGPLPAACVWVAPELTSWLSGHPFTKCLANVVSFGWGALAATLVLALLVSEPPMELNHAGAYTAVALAGIVLVLVNYLFSAGLGEALHDGVRLSVLVKQELLPTAKIDLGLLGIALLTLFLYDNVGIVGLAPLAAVLALPRFVGPALVRRRPVSQLQPYEATALYAQAIADALGLKAPAKRVLADAATHLGGPATLTRLQDFHAVMRTVLYTNEPWSQDGRTPSAEDEIPLESRILAVASRWSALTARDTREVSPKDALPHLKALAGRDLDPSVVAAAVTVAEDETF